MPKVEFQPVGVTIDVPPGTDLLTAARRAGVAVDSPCGGKGTCGQCLVRVASGQMNFVGGRGLLSEALLAEGYVLACQATVRDEPLTIEIPQQVGYEGGKFADGDETFLVRHELLPREWQYDPLAVKWRLTVSAPQPEDGLGDLDRLTRAIQQEWGPMRVLYSLAVIHTVANTLRAADGVVTVTLIRDGEQLHAIRLESGDTTMRHFGLAADVGTTTVAVQLIDLVRGRVLATRSEYNGQIPCGLDVISRINYAARGDGLAELRCGVLETLNRLIAQLAAAHGVAAHEISNAVISGNTTMMHLMLGLNPEHIRLAPYTPTLLEAPYFSAAEVGLEINPDSWVYLSPCVGSYVGGDITAGLLCTDLAAGREDISLFIDIGTNGEIVLGNNEFLLACACSAGPAFEGGGIDCGMRAALGAIEKVDVDPATGAPRCYTIGNTRPRGICGSGMIDLLANLLLGGWIDSAGKFDRQRPCPAIRVEGKKAWYVLAEASVSATDKDLVIGEQDIENIVRAKAAIYSACALMMEQIGMEFSDLAAVYIAGGFGRFLDLAKATVIGLVPDIDPEKFQYIGNSSLMGSYMVAVSQDYRQRQYELARRMTYFDLSNAPGYMDHYTAALFLPHTDEASFPSVVAAMQADREGAR